MSLASVLENAAKIPHLPNDQLDFFRRDAMAFLVKLPEPPLYRRRDDPVVMQAPALIARATELLARGRYLGAPAATLSSAIAAHAEWLCAVEAGKVEAAEPLWRAALVRERAASAAAKVWHIAEEGERAVFNKATGGSRFDPISATQIKCKLGCQQCRKTAEYYFSPQESRHRFVCSTCKTPFEAYFAEARTVDITDRGAKGRRYVFRVEELSGSQTRIEFDDGGVDVLSVAQGDLLAFIYAPRENLRGVHNLNSARVMWHSRGGRCFVATAAFGTDTPEVAHLRAFRDAVLLPYALGRAGVTAYELLSPPIARALDTRPRARAAVRLALRALLPLLRVRE